MNGKHETFASGESDEVFHFCGGHHFKTLSACEAADERNTWYNFKDLTAHESSSKIMASDEFSEQVTLRVCVEDTGIGIPFSAQDTIFMPFVQADSSASRNYGGTGIGLSISKCLVELMGGQINFISQPLVGSTFSFTAVFGMFKKKPVSDAKKVNLEELPSCFLEG